jgi:hypothetical protein
MSIYIYIYLRDFSKATSQSEDAKGGLEELFRGLTKGLLVGLEGEAY